MLSADGSDASAYTPSKSHGASSGGAPGAAGDAGGLKFEGPRFMLF